MVSPPSRTRRIDDYTYDRSYHRRSRSPIDSGRRSEIFSKGISSHYATERVVASYVDDYYPSVRRATVICYNCDSLRHVAADCPEPPHCGGCGAYDHIKKNCPHRDKHCNYCGKIGHLQNKCRARLFSAAALPPLICRPYPYERLLRTSYYPERTPNRPDLEEVNRSTRERFGRSSYILKRENSHHGRPFGAEFREGSHRFYDRESEPRGGYYREREKERERERGRERYSDEKIERKERERENYYMKTSDYTPRYSKRCGNCGKPGHDKTTCRGPAECEACGSIRHGKRECPRLNEVCPHCNRIGHMKVKCPLLRY
ncbi:uncharacterized protein LOC135121941 isoform X2 [Zophobas morio]|uniref:uncharacterized protein LOC135121941 isoform X2 n=1 Tax=Zophobas morio TaxID=2755281 RepID=UPI0030829795